MVSSGCALRNVAVLSTIVQSFSTGCEGLTEFGQAGAQESDVPTTRFSLHPVVGAPEVPVEDIHVDAEQRLDERLETERGRSATTARWSRPADCGHHRVEEAIRRELERRVEFLPARLGISRVVLRWFGEALRGLDDPLYSLRREEAVPRLRIFRHGDSTAAWPQRKSFLGLPLLLGGYSRRAFFTDALKQRARRFIVWILRDEFASEGFGEDGLVEMTQGC